MFNSRGRPTMRITEAARKATIQRFGVTTRIESCPGW
jgi:hypothetical protein